MADNGGGDPLSLIREDDPATGAQAKAKVKPKAKAATPPPKKEPRLSQHQQAQSDKAVGSLNKQVTNANHAMYIEKKPTTVRKGRCVKKFHTSNEFSLSFDLTMEAVPMRRSNIMHLCIAGVPNHQLPMISVLPGRVHLTIVSASHLQVEEKAGIYAEAKIRQRPDKTYKTGRIYGDMHPTWNFQQDLSNLHEDDVIEFIVKSKVPSTEKNEAILGKCELAAMSIYPNGFTGALELKGGRAHTEVQNGRLTKAMLHVSLNADCACRLVARVEQDGVKAEIEATDGISLQEEVRVEFSIFVVPADVAHSASDAAHAQAPHAAPRHSIHHMMAHSVHAVGHAIQTMTQSVENHLPGHRQVKAVEERTGTYMMVFKVKDHAKQMPVPGLKIPQPARIFAYVGSPAEPAAQAIVSEIMYRWSTPHERHEAHESHERNLVTFDMPKKEQALLQQVALEQDRSRKWRAFDGFFGVVLLFNAVIIGVQIELDNKDPGAVSEKTWNLIDNILLGIFTVEIVLRVAISGYTVLPPDEEHKYHRRTWKCHEWQRQADLWLAFDAFVVFVGFFFLVADEVIDFPFPVSVLRVLRLLKLAKMVRLVRAFRALGILVEALSNSFTTLFWTLTLLGMVVFVGAVLVVNLVEWMYENPTAEQKALLKPWFQVSSATWELLVMTTFDRWAEPIRVFAFDIGGFKASVTAAALLMILFFTSIGICNMVVGVMCNTAFLIIQKDTRMKMAGHLQLKREALTDFQKLLKTHNDRPLFKNDRFIGSDELLIACQAEASHQGELPPDVKEIKKCLKELELSTGDLLGLVSIFDEKGQIEIDGLVEAIAIVQLQRYFGNLLSANDMIFGKSGLGVRPVDMLFFAFSTREMEIAIRSTERSVMGLCTLTMDVLRCLDERSRQANAVARLNMQKLDVSLARQEAKQVRKWETAGQKPIGVRPLVKYVTQYRTTAIENGLPLRLDVFFGLFIMANGVVVGLQTVDVNDDYDHLFYLLDLIFTIFFTVEICLRAVLYADVREVKDKKTIDPVTVQTPDGKSTRVAPEDWDMRRVLRLRNKMIFGMIPPWPKDGFMQVWSCLPGFFANGFQIFDGFIVALCILDSVVFYQLRQGGVVQVDPSVFSAVRIFRLVRLAKLLRIFKVFPQLQRLLYVIMSTARLVLFTMLIMLIVLYMFAILMIVCYGDAARVPSDSQHYYYFGGILNSMISGWQLITFDDWNTLFDVTRKDYPFIAAFVFIPMMILGLMLMNMAVGVMCASAVQLVTRSVKEGQYEGLLNFIKCMGDLAELMKEELNSETLLQETIEKVIDTPLRSKKAIYDSRHEGKLMKQISSHAIRNATKPAYVDKVKKIFGRSKMQPVMIKHVFEKVDYERQGFLNINTFIIGALILKEDLAKLDVFASSSALRQMRSKCTEVSYKLATCHNRMEVLLQEMCALIYRDDFDEKLIKKPINAEISKDYFRLDKPAQEALRRLSEYQGGGALPNIKAMGRLQTHHGTGKVRGKAQDGYDDASIILLEGQHTQFRKEVDYGDIIIIEQTMIGGAKTTDKKKSAERKVIPLPVVAVLSDTLVKVKIDHQAEVDRTNHEHFFVVRQTVDPREKENKGAVNTLVQVPKNSFQPNVSQAVFEWDLQSKQKLRSKLEELEEMAQANTSMQSATTMSHGTKERIVELQMEENKLLVKHYQDLMEKVNYLHHRVIIFDHFKKWKEADREFVPRKAQQKALGQAVGQPQVSDLSTAQSTASDRAETTQLLRTAPPEASQRDNRTFQDILLTTPGRDAPTTFGGVQATTPANQSGLRSEAQADPNRDQIRV